jgi:hypothetical protein
MYWIAYDPDDLLVWGLGPTKRDALRDARAHCERPCVARVADFELHWQVETRGGYVPWYIGRNGAAVAMIRGDDPLDDWLEARGLDGARLPDAGGS